MALFANRISSTHAVLPALEAKTALPLPPWGYFVHKTAGPKKRFRMAPHSLRRHAINRREGMKWNFLCPHCRVYLYPMHRAGGTLARAEGFCNKAPCSNDGTNCKVVSVQKWRASLITPVFSDGIGSIAIVGATVRMDFVVLSPEDLDAEGRPKVVPQQRIVMTMDSFMRSFEKIREATQVIAKHTHSAETTLSTGNGQAAIASAPKHPFP
jgi:hypothetical protein